MVVVRVLHEASKAEYEDWRDGTEARALRRDYRRIKREFEKLKKKKEEKGEKLAKETIKQMNELKSLHEVP